MQKIRLQGKAFQHRVRYSINNTICIHTCVYLALEVDLFDSSGITARDVHSWLVTSLDRFSDGVNKCHDIRVGAGKILVPVHDISILVLGCG